MDPALLLAVCDAFDLGFPVEGARPVPGGLTNRLWRVETTRGVFAVKQMNRDSARADYLVWYDRAFMLEQAAFVAGLPMPRPVPVARGGSCLGEIAGTDGIATMRVHEWVEGVRLDNAIAYPPQTVASIASVLARIHNLRFESDARPHRALPVFGDDHWLARATRLEDANGWSGAILGMLPFIRELESYLLDAQNDRTRLLLSHRDADAKNFMRTSGDDLVLVDWDQAGPVNPRQDVANHALVWAGVHRGDPDPALAHAFVGAYREASGTSDRFCRTDLAELVALRLAWLDFNMARALGERVIQPSDPQAGMNVIERNLVQVPRFARSLDQWLAILMD